MTKHFILFAFALFCGLATGSAQDKGLNDYYSEHYNPRLVKSKENVYLFLGAAWGDEGEDVEIGVGYQMTERIQVGVNTTFGNLNMLCINGLYTYDAVPALDGGIFFRIGAEVGLMKGGEYYDEEIDEYVRSNRIFAFIGPVIQIQHQLCDWLSVYSRVKVLAGNKELFYNASIGLCVNMDTRWIAGKFSKR